VDKHKLETHLAPFGRYECSSPVVFSIKPIDNLGYFGKLPNGTVLFQFFGSDPATLHLSELLSWACS